ncbi:hypothetical protein HW432_05865 [Bacillus pumilus]|uniref:hypothetical protein n=1 Tax=Bacillus TaxID=1386 RepID=UPI000D7C21B5|nr:MULTISPECIES: hypothetical protein [Bacillus]MBB6601806.1 hypothetical protein [Bacillus pumilus]PYH25648.1 hypothetical protein US8_03451 [Bacillus altitudinis]WEZ69944.1 hypothetical protein P5623_11995 [Bacillus altitudinis]WLF28854.1 hypothetical protein Q6357_10340 [Bacillus altitudinis]
MKYRKKPVVVEAIQYDGSQDSYDKLRGFCGDIVGNWLDSFTNISVIYIQTLEGNLIVSPNDYVIKGVKGEFYPCKPDVFQQTYEPIYQTK